MVHAESLPHPGVQMRRDSTLKAMPHLLSTAPKMSTALAPKLRIAEVRVTNKVGIITSAHCLQKSCALPGDEERYVVAASQPLVQASD